MKIVIPLILAACVLSACASPEVWHRAGTTQQLADVDAATCRARAAHEVYGNILYDGDFIRTGIYTMKSGRGLVEVRFSGNDSFDLNAHTNLGAVDNQASDFLKPDTHSTRHSAASRYAHSLFATVGQGLAKVELSSYSGTIRILKRN